MKSCQKPRTPVNQTEIIPFSKQSTFPEEKHPKEETENDYLWLIKLSDMGHDQEVIKSIYAEVLYQRKKARGENPEYYIVPLMRILRDDHPFYYENAKRFIERKYDECFPDQHPVVSPEVMKELKIIAERRE